MPRSEEQNKKIRENRRQTILDAALHEFAEDGYSSASISKIAKHAGISKGLVYNYFESKEEILTTLILEGFEPVIKVFDPDGSGEFTEEKYRNYIETVFNMIDRDYKYWQVYFSIIFQTSVITLIMEKLFDKIMPFMQTLTNYYAAKGYKNPEAHMRFATCALDGVTVQYINDRQNFPLEEVKQILLDKLI